MMKMVAGVVIAVLLATVVSVASPWVAPNGIAVVEGYRNWQVIAPSFRPDKGHIRLVLGNETAIRAFRTGTRPFPDGTMFAKVAWKAIKHPNFMVAVVPGEFAQVEFMIKDSRKYSKTGGWGFARFLGTAYKPYGMDAGFVQECFGCHTPMAGNDFVFTRWAGVP